MVRGEPETAASSGNDCLVAADTSTMEVAQTRTQYKRLCIAANIINRFHAAGLEKPPFHLMDLACSPAVSKRAWETAACNARQILHQSVASSSEPMVVKPVKACHH